MLERFYPREWKDSAYDICWEEWYQKGMRGVIFDIDNTLVMHGAPASERAVALFSRLHAMGMKTFLLSNNREARVASFAEQVDSPYIYKAGKPRKRNYLKAVRLMGCRPDEVLFVGDQLFTDVYGANLCGIYGILVKPIDPREELQIVLKRYLEAAVLYFYKRKEKRNRR
ncbi:MAG: YqeG family HAD IIIA-type phosphatase [Eubacteriales bacterium]|nr:YqeG family HAD IIIA-type phosphatase [Eubacteriales bacterium]